MSEPGPGGPQHVFPPQHQNAQALALQLRHHRQQLKQTNTSGFYTLPTFSVGEPEHNLSIGGDFKQPSTAQIHQNKQAKRSNTWMEHSPS